MLIDIVRDGDVGISCSLIVRDGDVGISCSLIDRDGDVGISCSLIVRDGDVYNQTNTLNQYRYVCPLNFKWFIFSSAGSNDIIMTS